MKPSDIYPWQKTLWSQVQSMRNRFPHAVLLHGAAGIGKLQFANALAMSILCESPLDNGGACSVCLSCGWFVDSNHPDFRLIQPRDREMEDAEQEGNGNIEAQGLTSSRDKKKSAQISIEQIRALSEMVILSSHRNGPRIVVINPSENLNLYSASALLKMLEEPPLNMQFILVSHELQRLLPTIRSRCHKISVPRPVASDALSWLRDEGVVDPEVALALTGGAPLRSTAIDSRFIDQFCQQLARGSMVDPLVFSSTCGKDRYKEVIELLHKWIFDLFNSRHALPARYFPRATASLQSLAISVDLTNLNSFQRTLITARKNALHPLNDDLQLEVLVMNYARLFTRS